MTQTNSPKYVLAFLSWLSLFLQRAGSGLPSGRNTSPRFLLATCISGTFSEVDIWGFADHRSLYPKEHFGTLLLPAYISSWQLALPDLICLFLATKIRASLVAHSVKNLPVVQETWVRSLNWEDLLEKETATHSSILAWRILRRRSLAGYSPRSRKERTWLSPHAPLDEWERHFQGRLKLECQASVSIMAVMTSANQGKRPPFWGQVGPFLHV